VSGIKNVGQPHISLRGTSAHFRDKRWESHTALRIGRLTNLECVLDHPSISRSHAEVVITDQGWVIRDLGSTNGSFVNGVRVGRTDQKLRLSDVVRCGDVFLQVTALDQGGRSRLKTSGSFVRIQATVQRSWEQTVEVLGPLQQLAPGQGKEFLALLRAGYHLTRIESLEELLKSLLDDTVAVFQAQRASILLADENTGRLTLCARSMADPTSRSERHFSRTLAECCFNQGESLLCRDVNMDQALRASQSVAQGGMASIICGLLRSPRKTLGVLHLDRSPLQPAFNQEDFLLADAIAANISVGIESAKLVAKQRDLFLHTVTALAQAIEMRDHHTGSHTQRVTAYSLMLAEELRLSSAERQQLRIATPLHDIGKIAIDDAILRKPGKLTALEFEQMKHHVTKGAAILETIPELVPMIPIIRSHHERWDGTGYPDKLKADKIALMARIVAVADAFDAMTTDRPYRKGMSPEHALEELEDNAGTQFDPDCVEAFLRLRTHVLNLIERESSILPLIVGSASTEPLLQVLAACENKALNHRDTEEIAEEGAVSRSSL
jgi:putative nucleotidyltransferase with HDIG domain